MFPDLIIPYGVRSGPLVTSLHPVKKILTNSYNLNLCIYFKNQEMALHFETFYLDVYETSVEMSTYVFSFILLINDINPVILI